MNYIPAWRFRMYSCKSCQPILRTRQSNGNLRKRERGVLTTTNAAHDFLPTLRGYPAHRQQTAGNDLARQLVRKRVLRFHFLILAWRRRPCRQGRIHALDKKTVRERVHDSGDLEVQRVVHILRHVFPLRLWAIEAGEVRLACAR